eukprot:TRINITY_DN1716_c0_g3_i1.p1 TRINITY_DN1716_c0_g3~~TRINITY_DN1716_c0_g3_i1.p1  ORF type:complete len:551 (-),score=106.00 TRINITY_DN1716_c0_g3_i1:396-2048(-)
MSFSRALTGGLASVLAVMSAAGSNVSDRCSVEEANRVDCHFSENDCVSNGCCWKPIEPNPNNRPWCFKASGPAPPAPPAPTPAECAVDDYDKADCHQGSEDSCNAAGCCWKPMAQGSSTPWCFYKAGAVKVPHCTLKSAPQEPFSNSEVAAIRELFVANLDIQGSGMVVAAPDHNTGPGGDYYYAWQRDGALSMSAFLQTSPTIADVEEKMMHWIGWVERSTEQVDDNGDIFVEPKYLIPSGKPFPGGWCRPQNDGPGLRAITLMEYASVKPEVAQRAWKSVQRQLDWVAANYTSEGCDLWEEVRSGDFFWNRYTMRKALLKGAAFASEVGKDSDRSSKYLAKAKEITEKLSGHVQEDGFVIEEVNRQKDTAVIEAFNVGDLNDGVFAPLSREVISTLIGLSRTFCKAFDVNQKAAAQNKSGLLFGRYEGDGYAGGNPWVLLTASAATLLYRQSLALSNGSVLPSGIEFAALIGQDVTATSLLGAGDSIMNFMKTFLTNGLHMNEQIDRTSGALLSAKDLTWNYANVLKAMKARDAAAAAAVLGEAAFVV